MGRDLDDFVHPERISSQLICPICTLVLENPVQTATEHLFCEDELLEWMTRSNLCPVTKRVIDPQEIRRPGRIILNMLAELEVYCPNRARGCGWTGAQELLLKHVNDCEHRPVLEWKVLLQERDERIEALQQRVDLLQREKAVLEDRCAILDTDCSSMSEQLRVCQQRLRVFEALAEGSARGGRKGDETRATDADRLQRLSRLSTLQMESKK